MALSIEAAGHHRLVVCWAASQAGEKAHPLPGPRWYRQGERIRETDVDGKQTTKKCGENGEWVVVITVKSRSVAGDRESVTLARP